MAKRKNKTWASYEVKRLAQKLELERSADGPFGYVWKGRRQEFDGRTTKVIETHLKAQETSNGKTSG